MVAGHISYGYRKRLIRPQNTSDPFVNITGKDDQVDVHGRGVEGLKLNVQV